MSKKKKAKQSAASGKKNYAKEQRKQQAQQASHGTPAASQGQRPRSAAHPAPAAALRPSADPAPTPSPVVTLEPLAPIIVRSGRPFDAQTGPDAARFPPPSTLAGCLRTSWARQTGQTFNANLREQAVAGPLLVRLDANGQPHPLVPKPADAHYFGHGPQARCVRAEPRPFDKDGGADLPAGLNPVRLVEAVEEKGSHGPHWWSWTAVIAWRADPAQAPSLSDLAANGWSPSGGDRRTHVAIEADTLAAESGRLFQTEGLDLEPDNPWLHQTTPPSDWRLLGRFSESLSAGLVHLGGERRLARLHPHPVEHWPRPPRPNWFSQMRQQGGLTLTLLTPGLFSAGYRPDWLDETLRGEPPMAPGVRLQLVAAAVDRWQPHSGWDLAKQEARPTRKLVPAGATYWFTVLESPDDAALNALWLASLCDDAQDRRDGYGLALPAPWTPTV